MSTRRTRRAAAAAEVTEEVITIETRSKRTRAAPRKAAAVTATATTKPTKASTRAKRATTPTTDNTSIARNDAVASTPHPAPSTNNKRRLRSTVTESASPLRALDEQPPKRQRTTSRKTPARSSATARSKSSEIDDDEEETPIFFTKKFDSFNVEEPEPKTAFLRGDESAMALLRHVQEAARSPRPTNAVPEVQALSSPSQPESPSPSPAFTGERPSTPSRGIFASFTTPFTALKSLFSTPAPPSAPPSAPTLTPTPSRLPPANTFTEVLSMPPTPVGERPKRTSKKTKRPNRLVKALLRGVEQHEADQAKAWAEKIAADLQKDSAAGDKRKRLEAPVLFRDLEHFPASKPWQSGFSLPEDVLDLEDDDIVPAWAVYTSMVEEEQRKTKKTKVSHATPIDDDMPASLNELFGTSTASDLNFQPRRSIDPSPMFETPLNHREGGNIFTELHGHDAAANDRENLQRELKAGGSQLQKEVETPKARTDEGRQRAHDPVHGSFSVPDSDSEDEEEVSAPPVWTQAPPPAPTPAHVSLPPSTHQEEVERQRQKLMKHTPHKPSRLQQVSYPSPSVLSDMGDSPLKMPDFGEIPSIEPLFFGDVHLDAAIAALSESEGLQAQLSKMDWSMPIMTYDSDEEELSPA